MKGREGTCPRSQGWEATDTRSVCTSDQGAVLPEAVLNDWGLAKRSTGPGLDWRWGSESPGPGVAPG